jgi:hypothetical protein
MAVILTASWAPCIRLLKVWTRERAVGTEVTEMDQAVTP